ncbi:hypothetical protein FF38_07341, partial [Lucilia cuprina]
MIADFVADYSSKKEAIKAFNVLEESFYINAKSDTKFELKSRDAAQATSAPLIIESTSPTFSAKLPQSRSNLPSIFDLLKISLSDDKIRSLSADYGVQTAALLDIYNVVLSLLLMFVVQAAVVNFMGIKGNLSVVIGVLFNFMWVAVVLMFSATAYRSSVRRMRRNYRDDVLRETLFELMEEKDTESMEWMNNFLSKFWLIYEPSMAQMITEIGNEVLQEQTPGFIDSMKIDKFTL